MSKKPRRSDATFFGMLRDVGVTLGNKGQWPALLLITCVLVYVFRCPAEHLHELGSEVIGAFKEHAILSYVFNIVLIAGWALHSRWQRRQQTEEFDRIGREKSKLQEQQLGAKLASGKK